MKTIKDVAKKAGVGVSTVSRFLNKSGYISKEASTKIVKAMEELNYYPSAAARSIKSKKTNTVALLIPSISNAFFPELAETIENRLNKYGYKIILCNVNEDREKEDKYIDMIISNRVEGVISSTGYISQRLLDSGLPIVATDRMDVKNTQVVCVTSDHYGGAVKAVKHLLDSGCKSLVHLHGNFNVETALLRHTAFVDMCREYDIKYESIDVNSNYDINHIVKYDGVFVWADIDAIRFMNRCFENDIKIPEDIQIIGFDNIEFSKLIYPKLSTISQSINGLGTKATDMLVKMIESKETSFNNIVLETTLMKRDTTKGEKKMNIVVIGSINTDMVTETVKVPKIGETTVGSNFSVLFGGKGANQAICASRLGAEVSFIGCIGADPNGAAAMENFKENNINTKYVRQIPNVPTGVAQITIANKNNSIIVVKGANNEVSKKVIDESISLIENADLVLLQLEIPLETVEYVIDICHKKGIKTVLNPAPAVKLSKELIDKVTYLTPNEIECEAIFEGSIEETFKLYPNKLIVTKGSNGVDYYNGKEIINTKAHTVDVVDTTGAGDSFNGALSVGVVNGMSLIDAIKYGNKVASLAIQKLGAQVSMPYKEDIK